MAGSRDRRFVLGILGAMVLVIVVFSMFAPANDDDRQDDHCKNARHYAN